MIPAVQDSAELQRILHLPRRRLEAYDGAALSAYLTPYFLTPYGHQTGAKLRPLQAVALWEAMNIGGGFFAIPVGGGKTLLSWLLPSAMQARRPLLIIPAKHKKKAESDFREIARSWVQPRPPLQIRSYSELSHLGHVNDLGCDCDKACNCEVGYRPDLIILDEARKAKSHLAAVVKRMSRYMRKHPTTRVVVMDGTILRKSLKNFNHLLAWSLKEGAPIPLTKADLEEWCCAIDMNDRPNARTLRPGALLRLVDQCDEGEVDDLDEHDEITIVQVAYSSRLRATPGVIITDDTECDQPITIDFEVCPEDPVLDAVFDQFRTLYVLPDGHPMTDGLEVHRHGTTLSAGYYDRWEPPPPAEWLELRKAWATFVRDNMRSSQSTGRPLDTPGAVALAYADHPVYRQWKDIEPTFVPNTVTQWLSATPLQTAVAWLARQPEPSIIWVQGRPVGRALAAMTGVEYYGAQGCVVKPDGKPDRARYIKEADPRRSLIASIESISDGQNMQAWRRNLIVGMPKSAATVEQLLGRTHRAGQTRPVFCTVLVGSGDNLRAVAKAQDEAAHVLKTLRQTQKILRAELDRSALVGWHERAARSLRWA